MATVAHKWYGLGVKSVVTGAVDLDTDTFKYSLHTSTYVPNQDTDAFFNAATNELTTASGYTAGGVTLATVAVTYDSTSNETRIDWADFTWNFTAAKTWRYGVLRKARGGVASADELVAYGDWGADQTVSTDYTVQLDALGLLYIAAA